MCPTVWQRTTSPLAPAYDEAVAAAGYPDLQLLGIGNNGHIGFNEPDDHFSKGTHLVDLTESTIEANSRLFDSIDDVPRSGLQHGRSDHHVRQDDPRRRQRARRRPRPCTTCASAR